MTDDMRFYETFYGIKTDDWNWTYGSFSNHPYILTKEYISEGCSTTTSSSATNEIKFLYPHHIQKIYFIEGVITGHVTYASSGATTYLCKYRVTLGKTDADAVDSELFSTGWITVNKTLEWDDEYNIGEEVVLPFWIDAWENEKLTSNEKIYVQIESTCTDDTNFESCEGSSCTHAVLWHSNDSTWEDVKIEIPFKM